MLRTLRLSKVKTPILILSGMAGIEDKVRGLGFGADDYMTKPFHKDELVARIHAIVRRSKGHAQSVITTGDLVVNLDAKTVEVGGQRVHLTGKEYQMLELLSLRKGTTLTKEMFLNHLYGGMDEPELKIIDVFICKLRKKLDAASGGQNYIETVWGRGYVLREPDEEESAKAPDLLGARSGRCRSHEKAGHETGLFLSGVQAGRLGKAGLRQRLHEARLVERLHHMRVGSAAHGARDICRVCFRGHVEDRRLSAAGKRPELGQELHHVAVGHKPIDNDAVRHLVATDFDRVAARFRFACADVRVFENSPRDLPDRAGVVDDQTMFHGNRLGLGVLNLAPSLLLRGYP